MLVTRSGLAIEFLTSISIPKQIQVALAPGCIVDFGDHGFNSCSIPVVDVEQIQWTEVVSKVTQLSQQTNWPSRTLAGLFQHQLANLPVKSVNSVQVIGA